MSINSNIKFIFLLFLFTGLTPPLFAQGSVTIMLDYDALINNKPVTSEKSKHDWTAVNTNFVFQAADPAMRDVKNVNNTFDISRIALGRNFFSHGRDYWPYTQFDPITTTDQYIYTSDAMSPNPGAEEAYFLFDYTINKPNAYAWKAGTYTGTINFWSFTPSGPRSNSTISPASDIVKVVVPVFTNITMPSGKIVATIDDFKYFRGASLDQMTTSFSCYHTIPFSLLFNDEIVSDNKNLVQQFSGSNTVPGGSVQQSSIPVRFKVTKPDGSFSPVNDVPVGNKSTFRFTAFTDNATDMLNFINMGIYRSSIKIGLHEDPSPQTSWSATATIDETVTVADMGELISSSNAVNLPFSTLKDYQEGVRSDGKDYLTISKTAPYNLYVKMGNDNFTSGVHHIPAGILGINVIDQGEDITAYAIASLSTTPQLLVNGGRAVLDRKIFLQYVISAENASKLLNDQFKSGTYTADVIYTFSAM